MFFFFSQIIDQRISDTLSDEGHEPKNHEFFFTKIQSAYKKDLFDILNLYYSSRTGIEKMNNVIVLEAFTVRCRIFPSVRKITPESLQ